MKLKISRKRKKIRHLSGCFNKCFTSYQFTTDMPHSSPVKDTKEINK